MGPTVHSNSADFVKLKEEIFTVNEQNIREPISQVYQTTVMNKLPDNESNYNYIHAGKVHKRHM